MMAHPNCMDVLCLAEWIPSAKRTAANWLPPMYKRRWAEARRGAVGERGKA